MTSNSRRVTLIQQNDIHAHLEPHWELFWNHGKPAYQHGGGVARTAALVKQIRAETNGHCILVDCGDAIHGTAPAMWTEGAAIVPVLNHLGVELMTPGNWEFGFGPRVLRERVAEMNFPMIACNVERADSGEHEFSPSHVREIGGVRIGFVGITSPVVTRTMPKAFGAGLRFSHGLDSLPRCISKLRRQEQAELIVLVSHMGLAQDIELVKQVQDIDVVLSGHTHDRLYAPLRFGKTLLVQSGFDGSFIGRLDLDVQNQHVCDYTHRLIFLDESIAPDSEMQTLVQTQLAPHRECMDEVVGQTATALERMHVLEATMDNLITDAYLDATGADVAFSHGWRYGSPILPGNVTMADLWQMIPTNPPLSLVEMTGARIREQIEANLEQVFAAQALQQQGGYVIRVSGLQARVRVNNPKGARVQELEIAGSPVRADRVYRVAVAGGQDIKNIENKTDTGKRAIDVLCEYFQKHSPIRAELTHTKFVVT